MEQWLPVTLTFTDEWIMDGMETNQSLILIPADSLFSFRCVLLAPVSQAVREQTISPPIFQDGRHEEEVGHVLNKDDLGKSLMI